MPRRPFVAKPLRFPPELEAKLTALVERGRRTFTAQIMRMLEQWLGLEEQESRRPGRELPRVADEGPPPYRPEGG
jgi:hypothetical protein